MVTYLVVSAQVFFRRVFSSGENTPAVTGAAWSISYGQSTEYIVFPFAQQRSTCLQPLNHRDQNYSQIYLQSIRMVLL